MQKVKSLLALLSLGMVFIGLSTSAWGRPQIQNSSIEANRQNPSIFTAANNGLGAAEKEAVYEALIDRYTDRCDNKSILRHSKSAKLRQTAVISCLKAAYVKNYKEKIIEELIERDALPEMYKVEYVVNSMFYGLFRGENTIAQR